MVLSLTSSEAAHWLLAFFLLVVAVTLGWALITLSVVFRRTASFIRNAEREIVPTLEKVGGSIDRVNLQLDKVDQATDSALGAVAAVDQVARTISHTVRVPVEKLAAVTSGASEGFTILRKRRSWRGAVKAAKEAGARRRAELTQELDRD